MRTTWSGARCWLLLAGAHLLASAIVLAGVATLGGCASTPRRSTLTVEDFEETTRVMADRLRGSDLLAARTGESPRMVIAIAKVQNLTSDLIPESQQWYLMKRVQGSLPIGTLSRERNVAFVIPREQLDAALAANSLDAGTGAARRPTHEMTATFHSATRDAGKDRTDAYLVEYRITDLATGELKWTETFEFKREAVGRAYD